MSGEKSAEQWQQEYIDADPRLKDGGLFTTPSVEFIRLVQDDAKKYVLDEQSAAKRETMMAHNRMAKLESAFNPRTWTQEMSDAWHQNLPDTTKAFAELLKSAGSDGGITSFELGMMTCGCLSHYWRADVYRASDCPVCKLTARIKALEAGLAWYADSHRYPALMPILDDNSIVKDSGSRARALLTQGEKG